jgi:hypothetical protein
MTAMACLRDHTGRNSLRPAALGTLAYALVDGGEIEGQVWLGLVPVGH